MNKSIAKFLVANPHRSRNSSRPPAAKKGHHMAKTGSKKSRPNGGTRKHRKATKHNPMSSRRRRRNPSGGFSGAIGSGKELIVGGVSGLASAIITRQLPQIVLGGNNSGIEGYGANIVTGMVATWLAGMFGGPAAGRGAAIGAAVIVLDRVISEQVSPLAPYVSLSGVGDAAAYSKLGTIRKGFYTHPNLLNPDGSMYVPDPLTDAAVSAVMNDPQLAARIAQGVPAGRVGAVNPSALRRHQASGQMLSSRFATRFNQ